MGTAYIGFGSNLGERMANLAQAVDAVAHLPQTHVEAVSNAYESVPAYVEDQPLFLNAAAEVTTALQADALLAFLLDIETSMGRVRERDQGPRVIDLDLLLYDDEEWNSESLTLPHPGLAKRDFVVTPLLEIAPRLKLPDGTALKRSEATEGDVLRDMGPIPDVDVAHDVPVEPTEWVVVAQSAAPADTIVGFDASLQLKYEVLTDESIPVAWDPYEPGTDMDPFGLPVVYKLLVPADDAERARELMIAVDEAPAIMPGDPPAL